MLFQGLMQKNIFSLENKIEVNIVNFPSRMTFTNDEVISADSQAPISQSFT